jgi:transcriptional regulator with XRE-family HTH domain
MKNMNKKKIAKKTNKDPMAEARKNKLFSYYGKEANLRIRLAVEVYNKRKEKRMSQQELARVIFTTQKVISNIENGDVNTGLALLHRIGENLQFTQENWSRIFNFEIQSISLFSDKQTESQIYFREENQKRTLPNQVLYYSFDMK